MADLIVSILLIVAYLMGMTTGIVTVYLHNKREKEDEV